jgi:hypothetical protein
MKSLWRRTSIVGVNNLEDQKDRSTFINLELPCVSRSVWLICMAGATIGTISSIPIGLRFSIFRGVIAASPLGGLAVLLGSIFIVWISSAGRLKDMNRPSTVGLLTRFPPIDIILMGFSESKSRTTPVAGFRVVKEATIFTFGFLLMEVLCLFLLLELNN